MTVDSPSVLRMTRLIRAERQAVWDAWTMPEHMKKWACPAPDGVDHVIVDFRVGGSFVLAMEVDGKRHTAVGTYREIEAPRRLVYTWDWEEEENRMGETVVTVEFRARGEETEVVLVHEGFPAAEARDGHEQGWALCLDHFERLFG